MNLHTDGYESVVHDFAVAKIGLVAFASFLDFVGESLCVTMAGLEISFSELCISEGVHDVPFKQVIAPETAHENGQLLELSGCSEQGSEQSSEQGSEQSQKGQQGPKKGARKGCIAERPQSPQKGFAVLAGLVIVSVVFCYHFCSVEN